MDLKTVIFLHRAYTLFIVLLIITGIMIFRLSFTRPLSRTLQLVLNFCVIVLLTQGITNLVWAWIPDYEKCPIARLEQALVLGEKINPMWLLQPAMTFVIILVVTLK